jgi:CDP-glucose 4,6-dehydratase
MEGVGSVSRPQGNGETMKLEFYRGKRVLVTGHTGFKGAWLCRLLQTLGADVTGFALDPPTKPSLYELAGVGRNMRSIRGDVRNPAALRAAFTAANPTIVLHLAAQPLVRQSYRDPAGTYETNVMGTVNLLECVRLSKDVRSMVNVTTDKVYLNREWPWGYRENDELNGYDPYSNSKSCSELVTHSYRNAFFTDSQGKPTIGVSTARAGNVIGGGDFAAERILPDCLRAAVKREPVIVRNPCSVRPYQHVLEPLCAYLTIAEKQYENPGLSGSYNIGPNETDCLKTGELADLFVKAWGEGMAWIDQSDGGPHEANFLRLDCARFKTTFGWKPRWTIEEAVMKTVEWDKIWQAGGDTAACMDRQCAEYLSREA